MDSLFSQPHSSKYHVDSIMNQKIGHQKKSKHIKPSKCRSSGGSKKRSVANSSLNLAQDDYSSCMNHLRNMNKACKNITIETSKNTSLAHNGKPISCSRRRKIGFISRNSGKFRKEKKSKSSPLISSRMRKGAHSGERRSSRSYKNRPQHTKRIIKNQKEKLKILINDIDHSTHSPPALRPGSRGGYSSSRAYDSCKSKKNLKSCKSMKSIEPKSYSCRNKNEAYKVYKSKNHRSARDTKTTYSNYLSSEPLSKLSVFNNIVSKHGPQRSIDSNGGHSVKNENSRKNNKGGSVKCSGKGSIKNSKIYAYDSNQYTSNMYINEYTNSAQTSQFTFGPGPDSRASDIAYSGTTSANKSISKENVINTKKAVPLKKKTRHKTKKSNTSDTHHRSDSRGSKKSRKGSKKRSSRNQNNCFSGYLSTHSMKRPSSKSRNSLYKSSSSNNYQIKQKGSLKLQDFVRSGLTPSNQSYFSNVNLPSMSPFLAKMTQKSKNSRNEGLFKVQTTHKKPENVFNLLASKKNPVKKSRNGILTQIKSTAHAKTNSYFNIPGFAYGTNDKSQNSSSDRSSGSRSRSRKGSKREHSSNTLLQKKLTNEVNKQGKTLVPANNFSGASTQGSSIRDLKSTAKRKFQQECYYKSAHNAPMIKTKIAESQANTIPYEAISPKIILVEDNNKIEEEKFLKNKLKVKKQNLHEYLVNNFEPNMVNPLSFKNGNRNNQKKLKVHQTIESGDRNDSFESINLMHLNSEDVSLIEHNTSHLEDLPKKETQKDLEGLITILEKFETT